MKKIYFFTLIIHTLGTFLLLLAENNSSVNRQTLGCFLAKINTRAVTTLTQANDFEQHITQSEKPVVLKFYAPWCGACNSIKKFYIELAQKYPQLSFLEVSITTPYGKSLIDIFDLQMLPTFMFFKDGKAVTFTDQDDIIIDRIVGSETALLEKQVLALTT